MAKLLGAVALIGLCFGCGATQQPVAEPKMSPASAPVAVEETDSVSDAEEGTEPASSPSQPTKEEEQDESPKRACDVLDKSTCKVTVGCAWNDVRKCVKE